MRRAAPWTAGMMIQVPEVLTSAQVADVRSLIDAADWVDGNVTSGPQAALAKRNRQLPESSAAAQRAGEIVLDALGRNALFTAAALPAKVWPPLFNRYGGGERFGMIDPLFDRLPVQDLGPGEADQRELQVQGRGRETGELHLSASVHSNNSQACYITDRGTSLRMGRG